MTAKTLRLFISAFLLLFAQYAGAAEACDNPLQLERDTIFSLASLVMVHKDWQTSYNGRGHNIGSILVDKNAKAVFWARNAVTALDDATQHGEARLIQSFLMCPNVGKYAEGYTVYTTLEPCAMCSGMLAMTKINRVVFVQSDPDYGHVREALKAIKYPRIYEECSPKNMKQKIDLEARFEAYKKASGNNNITDFLLSAEAGNIFSSAEKALREYNVRYEENKPVLEGVKKFLATVTRETFNEKVMERCPTIK